MSPERLQKVLASAGIASRRDCEELISAGRVAVNGKVVRVLGTRIDPQHDEITVDGQPVSQASPRIYVMLNKPVDVISTAEDTHDRPIVTDIVDLPERLFPVGRLDQNSEGLLLLTNDGVLTQRLTHPSYAIEKEYRALLNEAPTSEALREWRDGVELEGVRTAPAWVELQERTDEGTWVRIVLQEGRKRQIREVAHLLGYQVLRLIRVREGSLTLGDLQPGEWRKLTDEEVTALWDHVGGRPTEDEAQDEVGEQEHTDERRPPEGQRRTVRARPGSQRERGFGDAADKPDDDQDDEQPPAREPRQERFSDERRPARRADRPSREGSRGPRSNDTRSREEGWRRSYRDERSSREDYRGSRRDDRPAYGSSRDTRRDAERNQERYDRPRRDSERNRSSSGESWRDDRPAREDFRDADRGNRRDQSSSNAPRRDNRQRQGEFGGSRRDDRSRREDFRGSGRTSDRNQGGYTRSSDATGRGQGGDFSGSRRDSRSQREGFRGPRRDDRYGQNDEPGGARRRGDQDRGERSGRDESRSRRGNTPGEYRDRPREDRYGGERDRPASGNERSRGQTGEKRGPSRSWQAQNNQEQRDRRQRSAPYRSKGSGYSNRDSGPQGRPQRSFRPKPPRDPEEEE